MISLWIVILSFIVGVLLISQDRWILGAPFILGAIFLWIGIVTICGKGALQYCGIM